MLSGTGSHSSAGHRCEEAPEPRRPPDAPVRVSVFGRRPSVGGRAVKAREILSVVQHRTETLEIMYYMARLVSCLLAGIIRAQRLRLQEATV